MSDRLKLCARDSEDFDTVAAILQDALIPQTDMRYLPNERRFVVVANRFRWENCPGADEAPANPPVGAADDEPCARYERVNCGLWFDGVCSVRRLQLDPRDRGRILELLTFRCEPEAIVMLFAGGAALRLEGPTISCHIEDLGEPWPTLWRPRHPIDESDAA